MKNRVNQVAAGMMLIMALAMTACGSGQTEGAGSDSTAVDTVVTLELDPQSFPVNEIPDNQFGKELKPLQPGTLVAGKSLAEVKEPMPAWLDAIISRESIVAFGKVMAQNPDELEFLQKEAHLLDAGGGLKAFWTSFSTRPSDGTIIVWGAYTSEKEVYWASMNRKGQVDFLISSAQMQQGGVRIDGAMTSDSGPNTAYRSEIKATEGSFGYSGKP